LGSCVDERDHDDDGRTGRLPDDHLVGGRGADGDDVGDDGARRRAAAGTTGIAADAAALAETNEATRAAIEESSRQIDDLAATGRELHGLVSRFRS
jgi:hypothetical protein